MKTVKLSEFAPEMSGGGGDFNLPLFPLDQNLAVTGIRISQGREEFGEYAVVTVEGGIQYRTSSGVLVDQFKKIVDKFDGDIAVWMRATQPQGKRYYTLTDPVEE